MSIMKNYKLNPRGFRVTKNGSLIKSIEKEAFKSTTDLGKSTKQNGTYYFFFWGGGIWSI